ncbi:MAG TPA: DUF2442 domain-containing protein [Longimicrobium sp.]|nr:DUF2442 domain-containing protein [Longimicrobium sp.]
MPTSLDCQALDRQYLDGIAAAAASAAMEPRAISARYDATDRVLVLQLRDGTSVAVPVSRCSELAQLKDDVIAAVRVTPSGYGLHWDTADIHLAVPILLGFGATRLIRPRRARR